MSSYNPYERYPPFTMPPGYNKPLLLVQGPYYKLNDPVLSKPRPIPNGLLIERKPELAAYKK